MMNVHVHTDRVKGFAVIGFQGGLGPGEATSTIHKIKGTK